MLLGQNKGYLWKQILVLRNYFSCVFYRVRRKCFGPFASRHPEFQLTKIQSDTKKRELLKNPTKIEEIKKKLLTEIEPLQLAF